MGQTVLDHRWALEDEIAIWRDFRKALPSDKDKQAFEEMMDLCRVFASESSNATKPIIFEPMVIAILLGQQKKITPKHANKTTLFPQVELSTLFSLQTSSQPRLKRFFKALE
jgi:hypothetical protein